MYYGPELKFHLNELSLYFDTVAKDRLDSHATGRRNAELLDLRDQMLRLSDREYEVLMRTFRAAVKDMGASRAGDGGQQSGSAESAQSLYSEVRPGSGSSDPKVSAIS